MNTKIIIAAALVLVVVAIYLYSSAQATLPTAAATDEAQISAILSDQYSSLIQDQLNSLSIDQASFNNQVQDSIASDTSQFY